MPVPTENNAAGTADAAGVEAGLTPAADQNAAVIALLAAGITDDTPIESLPPALKKYITGLRSEAAAKRKADKDRVDAIEAERLKGLEAKGEYDKIALELKTQNESLQLRLDSYEKAVKGYNKARIDSMPESDRDLIPDHDDPVMISRWLDKYHERAAKLAASTEGEQGKGNGNGANGVKPPTPPPTNAGAAGAGAKDALAARRENAFIEAREVTRSLF